MSAMGEELSTILLRFGSYCNEIWQLEATTQAAYNIFEMLPEILPLSSETANVHGVDNAVTKVRAIRDVSDKVLNCHLAMGLWSAFDAAVEDIVVAIMTHRPDLIDSDHIKGAAKVTLSEALTKDTRTLATEVLREHKRTAPGSGRADSLLRMVGVDVPMTKLMSRRMRELAELRNVIAHRGSVVDKKAEEACPWLELKVGDRVSIPTRRLQKYVDYLMLYVAEAFRVLMESVGVEPPTEKLARDRRNLILREKEQTAARPAWVKVLLK